MPVLYDWDIPLEVDDVLTGQGADPLIIRKRSPRLIPVAEKALTEAKSLIKPVVIFRILDVKSFAHNRLILDDGHVLFGDFVSDHLPNVAQVIIAACTISDNLGKRVSEIIGDDIVYALALDGAGSSSVQNLAALASKWFEDRTAEKEWTTTIPLNPGMIGWPVSVGQKQIFDILDYESKEIILSESSLMMPFKSLSFVLGIGPDVETKGSQCQYCSLQTSCFYSKCHHNE
ncbi:MAG: hypothetical protein AB9907_02695 [Flexilinea sp.]